MFRFAIKDSWVMPSRVSLLFVDDLEQVYAQCVKSAARLYFAVSVCSSFSWSQHYSVLALNIVDSPTLVLFRMCLVNLSKSCQIKVVSTNLPFPQAWENWLNPRNQRIIHEVLFKSSFPNLVAFWLCLFTRNKINSTYTFIQTSSFIRTLTI